MATEFLAKRGAGRHEFGLQLMDLSERLNTLYFSDGTPQEGASKGVAEATELWMKTYLQFYTDPPERLARRGFWKQHMDSVAGPLRRLASALAAKNYPTGHKQLEILQAILTEFVGAPPLPDPNFLGGIRHALDSLEQIQGESSVAQIERQARIDVLKDRYTRWKRGCTGDCSQDSALSSFERNLHAFATANSQGKPLNRKQHLTNMLDELKSLGLAWGARDGAPPNSARASAPRPVVPPSRAGTQ